MRVIVEPDLSFADGDSDKGELFDTPSGGGYTIDCLGPGERNAAQPAVLLDGSEDLRRGVPSKYICHIWNNGNAPAPAQLISFPKTEEVLSAKIQAPIGDSIQTFYPEDLLIGSHPIWMFVVPRLAPGEHYRFDLFVEASPEPIPLSLASSNILAMSISGDTIQTGDKDRDYTFIRDIFYYCNNAPTDSVGMAGAMHSVLDSLIAVREKGGAMLVSCAEITKALTKIFPNLAAEIPASTGLLRATQEGTLMHEKQIQEETRGISCLERLSADFRNRLHAWWKEQPKHWNKLKSPVVKFFSTIGEIITGIWDMTAEAAGINKSRISGGRKRTNTSKDPNEKEGPAGMGEAHCIGMQDRLYYTIRFENMKEATAPAYRIRITDTLAACFDFSTVRFEEVHPANGDYFWQTSFRDGILHWDVEGIELPPNVHAPEGEGYVRFSVKLKEESWKTGLRIENKASIIFDKNKPIETNLWSNTVDLDPPVTTVLLPDLTARDTAVLRVKSEDNVGGSGLRACMYYLSINGGDFKPYGFSNDDGTLCLPVDQHTDGQTTFSYYALGADFLNNLEQKTPKPVSFRASDMGTGITVPDQPDRVVVSPNPSDNGVFTINGLGAGKYSIYTIDGKCIRTGISRLGSPLHIDLANEPIGVYLLKYPTGTCKLVRK